MKGDFTPAETAEITGLIVQTRLLRILQCVAAVAGVTFWITEGFAAGILWFVVAWFFRCCEPSPRPDLMTKADRALNRESSNGTHS